MNSCRSSCRRNVLRGCCLGVVAVVALPAVAAAMFVGSDLSGPPAANDDHSNVLAIINAYNAVNNPDLTTDFTLFKKSDDDASYVFNSLNGFSFYSDPAGTSPISSESGLTSTSTAYFSYSGAANLSYYTVKGGPKGFSLYTVDPGLNLLAVEGGGHTISHVSFWTSPTLNPHSIVPEPSTLVMGLASIAGVAMLVRWHR